MVADFNMRCFRTVCTTRYYHPTLNCQCCISSGVPTGTCEPLNTSPSFLVHHLHWRWVLTFGAESSGHCCPYPKGNHHQPPSEPSGLVVRGRRKATSHQSQTPNHEQYRGSIAHFSHLVTTSQQPIATCWVVVRCFMWVDFGSKGRLSAVGGALFY